MPVCIRLSAVRASAARRQPEAEIALNAAEQFFTINRQGLAASAYFADRWDFDYTDENQRLQRALEAAQARGADKPVAPGHQNAANRRHGAAPNGG